MEDIIDDCVRGIPSFLDLLRVSMVMVYHPEWELLSPDEQTEFAYELSSLHGKERRDDFDEKLISLNDSIPNTPLCQILCGAFVWRSTIKGYGYWHDIQDRLQTVHEQAKAKNKEKCMTKEEVYKKVVDVVNSIASGHGFDGTGKLFINSMTSFMFYTCSIGIVQADKGVVDYISYSDIKDIISFQGTIVITGKDGHALTQLAVEPLANVAWTRLGVGAPLSKIAQAPKPLKFGQVVWVGNRDTECVKAYYIGTFSDRSRKFAVVLDEEQLDGYRNNRPTTVRFYKYMHEQPKDKYRPFANAEEAFVVVGKQVRYDGANRYVGLYKTGVAITNSAGDKVFMKFNEAFDKLRFVEGFAPFGVKEE